ncbi:MAG TPA: hypothetical protein VFE19_11920 [Jatrophihabitantaceae bacterium]|jgi:hypothetical protein|nr:hypothetical protein [Jatrophihabitantaceae bacterium]
MRRSVLAFVAIIGATFVVALSAGAVGPGGWNHLGVGASSSMPSLNGHVYALNSQNPGVLYAGGDFTTAGGNSKAKRIARWNGSTWSALGNTPLTNGSVLAIAYKNGKVYAGGTFLNAGGNADADFLAVWDGTSWAPFCNSTNSDPTFGGSVDALQIIGNTLYVGGAYQNGAGIDAADYLLACDLTTGASSATVDSDGDFEGAVYALTADSNGTLYAGGQFVNLDNIEAADHVAAYDGTWHAMGTGPDNHAVDDFVRGLTAKGTDVYVGTDSLNVAGIAQADHVARWNGTSWSAVGANTAGNDGWFSTTTFINALTTYGSLVVAAGSFQNANGTANADEIAYFDGTKWRPIGSDGAGNGPLPGANSALSVVNGNLYASGNFTSAGGDALARSVAAYSLRLPDSMIGGTRTGHFAGNGVYSSTGAGEARNLTIKRGKSETCYVKVQNDGLVAAAFTIKATGGANGFKARYFHGNTNVTPAVDAGTYATGTIPARGFVLLRVKVSVAHSSANSATFVVAARSTSGTPTDAVRALVKAI